MSKIVAIEHLTLDGVYQGPARKDEDTRDSFEYSGWASVTGNDAKMQEKIGERMGNSWSLLVGRITYEDLYSFWPKQPPNSMTEALNRVEKFVVSTTITEVPWQNSILLKGNATEKVGKLKKEHEKTLVIFGSGMLVQSLMKQGLVDEYVLIFHPVVLGKGLRLFPDGSPYMKLKLVDTVTTSAGVIIAIHRPVSGSSNTL
jgi:dihydrofolate reductase